MKCPYCRHQVNPTWQQYWWWKALSEKCTCPHCDKRFRMGNGFGYLLGIFCILCVFDFVLALSFGATVFWAGIMGLSSGLVVIVAISQTE